MLALRGFRPWVQTILLLGLYKLNWTELNWTVCQLYLPLACLCLKVTRFSCELLSIVGRFSKAWQFVPFPKLPSASETSDLIFDRVFWVFGLPHSVVSNRRLQLTCLRWAFGGNCLSNRQRDRLNQDLEVTLSPTRLPGVPSFCRQNMPTTHESVPPVASSYLNWLSNIHVSCRKRALVFPQSRISVTAPPYQHAKEPSSL